MLKRLFPGFLACLLLLTVCALLSADNEQCGLFHGKMIDGGGAYFSIVCASGSHVTSNSSGSYPDAVKANHVFEERLQKAITVIELNQKLDSQGRCIGRRAVATFTDDNFSKPITSIFWVDDQIIRSIDSTSSYLALYAERVDK